MPWQNDDTETPAEDWYRKHPIVTTGSDGKRY